MRDEDFVFCSTRNVRGELSFHCDPISIITAATSIAALAQGQDNARRANRAAEQEKKKQKEREAQLAAEEAAKVAAAKKAETLGQRAGTGGGADGAPSTRSTFIGAAKAGTGMGNEQLAEDRIGRATLFGN
jgi:hypothetical protein